MMQYRTLGRTNLQISALSFGAGPVSTLMIGDDADSQRATVEHALRVGINWFDTAAGYGQGRSERNLGRALEELKAGPEVHIATKVRLAAEDLADIRGAVRRSFEESLVRLRLRRITLLQLHNSVTVGRGDEPTSITPADVLGPAGVADAFEELRAEGAVGHLGLTGIGRPAALREVVRSARFEAMQVPYHLLNPSAGRPAAEGYLETDYGNVIAACAGAGMGVLAIRVFAGGALLGLPPSPHTLTTPFFPLSLYELDRRRAARVQQLLGPDRSLSRDAVRFVLDHPDVSSALIGFANPRQIDEALQALGPGPTPDDWESLLAVMSQFEPLPEGFSTSRRAEP